MCLKKEVHLYSSIIHQPQASMTSAMANGVVQLCWTPLRAQLDCPSLRLSDHTTFYPFYPSTTIPPPLHPSLFPVPPKLLPSSLRSDLSYYPNLKVLTQIHINKTSSSASLCTPSGPPPLPSVPTSSRLGRRRRARGIGKGRDLVR